MKIFDNADLWIESHILARTSVVTVLVQDVTLDKPGRFVGGSVSLDGGTIVDGRTMVIFRNTDDSELTYGQAVTAIRTEIGVNAPRELGIKLIVLLKK